MNRKRVQMAGLDELLIVNPSEPMTGGFRYEKPLSPHQYFLGEDGALYQQASLQEDGENGVTGALGEETIFLGEDGTLYVHL